MFFHSCVASLARKVSSEKRAGAEDRLPKMLPKFAPRCGERAIRKSKSFKIDSSDVFWKFKSAKFAPRRGARAI